MIDGPMRVGWITAPEKLRRNIYKVHFAQQGVGGSVGAQGIL